MGAQSITKNTVRELPIETNDLDFLVVFKERFNEPFKISSDLLGQAYINKDGSVDTSKSSKVKDPLVTSKITLDESLAFYTSKASTISGYGNRSLVDKETMDEAIAAVEVQAGNGLTNDAGTIKLGGEITETTILSSKTTGLGQENEILDYYSPTQGRRIIFSKWKDYDTIEDATGRISIYSTGSAISYTSNKAAGSNNFSLAMSDELGFQIYWLNTANDLPGGIYYNGDYSAFFTDRSLVDKGYVDAAVGANNELSEVLANGNTTGGTDIVVSDGDVINLEGATGSINAFSELKINSNNVTDFSKAFLWLKANSELAMGANTNVYAEFNPLDNSYLVDSDYGSLSLNSSNVQLTAYPGYNVEIFNNSANRGILMYNTDPTTNDNWGTLGGREVPDKSYVDTSVAEIAPHEQTATTTDALLTPVTGSLQTTTNSSFTFKTTVVGKQTAVGTEGNVNDTYVYIIEGSGKNIAGTASLINISGINDTEETPLPTENVDTGHAVNVGNTGASLDFGVTGLDGTISWKFTTVLIYNE